MLFTLYADQGKKLVVNQDSVKIFKEGGLFSEAREKSIPIRHITSVEVKKPSAFVGFIQFSLAGAQSSNSSYTFTGGAMDAVKDENAVVFMGDDKYQIALQIKSFIDSWSDKSGSVIAAQESSVSIADEIRKLKALLDEGLITQIEFEQGKQKLLSL
jgi:hypothetical protein